MTTVRAFRHTRKSSEGEGSHRDRPVSVCVFTLLFSAVILSFYLFRPEDAAKATLDGLTTATTRVLPSLFPFFALSCLLTESGMSEALLRLPSTVLSRWFGISSVGASAVLVGIFCGFPVGARIASSLYGRKMISRAEAERLILLSSTPSFAFLYATVGAGFFSSPAFGIKLYLSTVLSAAILGILLRKKDGVTARIPARRDRKKSTLAKLLTGAIKSAAETSLTVISALTLFSVLTKAISALGAFFHIPAPVLVALSGLLEISCGTKEAAETLYGLCGLGFCGFFAGFGGLCAHLQVIATAEFPLPDRAEKDSLSFRSYFFYKVLQGVFTALLVLILP